jgi:protein O-GlcNAc transferase
MTSVITICEEHLSEPRHQNVGILAEKSLDDWLLIVALATARPQCDHSLRKWVHRFRLFADVSCGRRPLLNEGSFLLRLIDWYRARKQHERYIGTYGEMLYCEGVSNSESVVTPAVMPFTSVLSSATSQKVPTVLPFHTVCQVYVIIIIIWLTSRQFSSLFLCPAATFDALLIEMPFVRHII